MNSQLFPIGSIVILKEGTKKLTHDFRAETTSRNG